MLNKKLIKVAGLALSVCAISACKEISASPAFYGKDIQVINKNVVHNTMDLVYDTVVGGSIDNTKVLNALLDDVANTRFGDWETVKKAADGDATAMAATKATPFFSAYAEADKEQAVKNFAAEIEKRISNAIYSEISGGSYSKRNKFSEKKYADYLKSQMYDIKDHTCVEDEFITEDWKDNIGDYIDIDAYVDYTNTLVKTYYRNLLVEDYMVTQNRSLLTRTYARHINYVALPNNSSYYGYAKKLMTTFAETYFVDETTIASVMEDGVIDYSYIREAWNGLPSMSQAARDLLAAAEFKTVTTEAPIDEGTLNALGITESDLDDEGKLTYYKGTKFAEMFDKYVKITDNRDTTKNDSEFTGSNAYSKYVGLEIKLGEIYTNASLTTKGWYTKNGASTSLPSDVSSRLFKITTAKHFDELNNKSRPYEDGSGDYVADICGAKFLIPSSSQKGDKFNYIIYDDSSSTYYMVQILEAGMVSKFADDATANTSYAKDGIEGHGALYEDTVLREIAKLYKDNSTYTTDAYLYYLENLDDVVYYDEDVYNYFSTTYPDLFED